MKFNIKVCLSPSLFPVYSDKNSIVVVVDVLRATSAICTAFDLGVQSIVPVSMIEDALDYKGKKNHLLAAERNGSIVSGFDIGNSPTNYRTIDFNGKTLVLTTTNGTKAINIAKDNHEVVIGSFLNIKSITDYLKVKQRDVIILCAGWRDDFCLEDTIFAGALTDSLMQTKQFYYENDSTINALLLYENAKDNLYDFLSNSQHRRRLQHLGIDKDVYYCLEHNKTSVVPIYSDGRLIPLYV